MDVFHPYLSAITILGQFGQFISYAITTTLHMTKGVISMERASSMMCPKGAMMCPFVKDLNGVKYIKVGQPTS